MKGKGDGCAETVRTVRFFFLLFFVVASEDYLRIMAIWRKLCSVIFDMRRDRQFLFCLWLELTHCFCDVLEWIVGSDLLLFLYCSTA